MTSLTSSEWQGAFLPFKKHRLGTGDISNHLVIVRITPLEDVDEDERGEDIENEYGLDELTRLGDGPRDWLVEVGFLPGFEEIAYEYIISLPEMDDKEKEALIFHSQMTYGEVWDGKLKAHIDVRELRKRDPDTYDTLDIPDAHEALHLIGEDLSK